MMKTINILFIHPNFPGQFKALLNDLVKVPNAKIAFITRNLNAEMKGVDIQRYQLPEKPITSQNETVIYETYKYLRGTNNNFLETNEVTKAALKLQQEKGFEPHVIIGHIGWSGTLFMKDVFPNSKIIAYCEWFYRPETSWQSFSGEELSIEQKISIRMQNIPTTLCMESMDVGVSPMLWQRSVHPLEYQDKIEIIHEGIDTQVCKPYPLKPLRVPGANLKKGAKIITFVSRSLEPARGFFTFMEAVEKLCKKDKDIQFVVVGRERAAYSESTGDGLSYKQQAVEKYQCDWDRVHFTGKLNYEDYLSVLRNSTVHIYLSSPIFLSWSLLEAMSSGCAIVSSDNAPVNEVIQHDVTGRLVPFFDAQGLSDQVLNLLESPIVAKRLGEAARKWVVKRYDQKKCVKQWKELILRVVRD